VLLIFPLPHIFEGMRAVLAGQPLPSPRLIWAFGLDAIYLLGAFAFFAFMFSLARRRGLLLKLQD
jgi:ABC-type polysaccharide/polyol phosphate export permease